MSIKYKYGTDYYGKYIKNKNKNLYLDLKKSEYNFNYILDCSGGNTLATWFGMKDAIAFAQYVSHLLGLLKNQ